MLAVALTALACGLLEAAWSIWSYTVASNTAEEHVTHSPSELDFGAPAASPVGVPGTRPRITPAMSAFSLVMSPPKPTKSISIPLVSHALAVHLIVCAAISVSYLFRFDGAVAVLKAAAVGFGLCAGDAVALGLSLVPGKSVRGWSLGPWIPAISRGWMASSALAWPLTLVWLGGVSSLAGLFLAGVVVWGLIGMQVVCSQAEVSSIYQVPTTSVAAASEGSRALFLHVTAVGVYSGTLLVTSILITADLAVQRALLAGVVVP
eukprot:RCo037724